ncbi:MAG: hypothetical protein AABY16_03540 [Nanoarchaeota archaeon]
MNSFSKICRDIKSIKIQGAINVAKAGIKAYSLKPTKKAKNLLIHLRPTEPALFHALNIAEKISPEKALQHFDNAQNVINHYVFNFIQYKSVIFTHCHSNTLANALIHTHKSGKRFSVISTETRPLFQGRKTAKQLSKAGIKVIQITDSAVHEFIKNTNLVMIGADAVLNSGVINKTGSTTIAEIAHVHKKPFYVVADSWKFYPKNIKIESRHPKEVWNKSSKNLNIRNPSFELIPKNYITKIISEFGVQTHNQFIKSAKKSLKNSVSA